MKPTDHYWYSRNAISFSLLPLAGLFRLVVWGRRRFYTILNHIKRRPPTPVIVVGNITVGGTGKTPMVIWLARLLKTNGFKPGIVSRGYGGKAKKWPQVVTADSDPGLVGDEPVLIAHRTGCPLVAAPDRPAAVRLLLRKSNCDVVISDDGLQHYAMPRDIEILMIDGKRRFGNGYCLPAGPLREPVSRMREVDFVVANGLAGSKSELAMGLVCDTLHSVEDPAITMPVDGFRHSRVNAVAGIGNPDRFYDTLRLNGLEVNEHRFPDHHVFTAEDLDIDDELPLLMTEKDAVKCRQFGGSNRWYMPVSALPDKALPVRLIAMLRKRISPAGNTREQKTA